MASERISEIQQKKERESADLMPLKLKCVRVTSEFVALLSI